jgi:Predicted transcriptional regulators
MITCKQIYTTSFFIYYEDFNLLRWVWMDNIFPSRLKQARKLKKITQSDLATLTGVSRQTISNYEAGLREPSVDILSKLIDILNVSFDWLNGKNTILLPQESLYDNVNIDTKGYIDIFSNRLQTIRRKKNYTEADCAKKLKVSLPDYVKIENSEIAPNLLVICKIAELFDISVDWLLGKDATVPLNELVPRKYIPAPYDAKLKERLIMLREIFHYSIEDVAFFIKINPKEYELFELGKADPPVAIMLNLSRLYKLPVESLSLENSYFITQLKNRFNTTMYLKN